MVERRPLLVAGTFLLALASSIGSDPQASVLYRLGERSTLQKGCFPPCMCPVMETSPLHGTFELALISVGDVFDFYEVQDVRWLAPGPSAEHTVRGSGFYKVSTITGENEMSLDLAVDQNASARYTSGQVPVGAEFPEIDVPISMNGGVCFDTVMEVRARPTPRLEVGPRALTWDSGLEVVGYDVVKGNLSILRATGGAFDLATDECLANDLQDRSIPFASNPEARDGFFILVRAGKSTYDTGLSGQVRSRDPGIAASPASCP